MSSSRVPSGSTVPFTPRQAKRKTSHQSYFTDQEFSKFAGTLASVRKVRPDTIIEDLDRSGDVGTIVSQFDNIKIDRAHRTSSRAVSDRPNSHASASSRPRPRDVPSSSRPGSRPESRPESSTTRPESATSSSSRPHSARETDHTRDRERETLRARETTRDRERESKARVGRDEPSRNAPVSKNGHAGDRLREVEVEIQLDPISETSVGEVEPEPAAETRLLDGVPLDVQEAWICEDLMFVLQGVEGSLIRYAEDYDPLDADHRLKGVPWQVDPSIDPSLLSLVDRLLPLATFFTSVEASIELRNAPEFGMINHALSSGIRGMLKEYRILTAQLETLFLSSSTFTLQTLYFHLHPTLHTMSLLSSLCMALETDDVAGDMSSDASDDDGLGGMAEELGLGGAGLKGLMKNLNAREGLIGGDGLVLGGEVLGIICEREATMSGDPTAATLHSQLLLFASQPYSRMLIRWISTGYLSDPFEEFMVKESGHITKGVLESDYTDEYWDGRYTLRDGSSLATTSKVHSGKAAPAPPSISGVVPLPRKGAPNNRLPGGACIPAFLQPWKHKILLAGKYLNVIRECGIEVKKPGEVDAEVEDAMVVMNEPKFYKRIEDAYIHANKTLLKLLVEEQELIPHLRSMKHFFFVDQSDFLTNFLDLASNDLTRKAARSVSIVKLQSLLDLAVRNPASSSSNDPYKDNLKVTMASQGLYDWLLKIVTRNGGGPSANGNDDGGIDFAIDFDRGAEPGPKRPDGTEMTLMGIDALAFDYSVKFPLSLVLSRKAITRYQLIFRFLVHLHHLESGLSAMWLEHKVPAWRDSTGNADMDHWKSRVFALRTRMLAFVRQVLAYATGEVLESNWRALEVKLANLVTVDQLMRDHVDFLDTCLKQCMLTNSKLLSVYAKLMKTMSAFVLYQESFNKVIHQFRADPITESDAGKASHRWNVLQKFEVNFDHHSNLHLDAVTYNAGSENVALLALVTRLHQITLRL